MCVPIEQCSGSASVRRVKCSRFEWLKGIVCCRYLPVKLDAASPEPECVQSSVADDFNLEDDTKGPSIIISCTEKSRLGLSRALSTP